MLKLNGVYTAYGSLRVLKNLSLEVGDGEIVSLLGGNAAGKTTTIKTIIGIVRPLRGSVEYNDARLDKMATEDIISKGIAVVPEARRIFGGLSVLENLELGAYTRNDRAGIAEDLGRVLTLFPRLKERLKQRGGTLSGGEQQMLAIGRALMARPTLICMDEPSMGLSPLFVERVFDIIQEINRQGVTIFMVEQNAQMALSISTRGYVLETGELVLSGGANELLNDEMMKKAYLGA
ncbi:MAG: ABC transporter ATP-binding protein [Chloroflexota bacterium]